MKFATKVAALAVTGVLGLSGALIGGAAASAATPDCKTVTAKLVNHPDSGVHGTWATDAIDRTVKVCQLDTPTQVQLEKAKALSTASPFSVYSVEVVDEGTFVTKGGNNLSPQAGHKLLAGVKGTLSGYYNTTAYSLKNWGSWNGPGVQGQTYNPGASTGEWLKMLFGVHAQWSDPSSWKWVYKTCNEEWSNAASGNKGDITGYSKFACPRVVFEDNCDGYTNVIVFNDAPWKLALLKFKLSTDGIEHSLVGQEQWSITVKTTDLVKVSTLGREWKVFAEHTWAKPKDCATPTTAVPTTKAPASSAAPTTAAASTTPPVVATPQDGGNLPTTGSSLTTPLIAGGLLLAAGAGLGLFLVIRRRRDTETVA